MLTQARRAAQFAEANREARLGRRFGALQPGVLGSNPLFYGKELQHQPDITVHAPFHNPIRGAPLFTAPRRAADGFQS